jgi:hypothetical protein
VTPSRLLELFFLALLSALLCWTAWASDYMIPAALFAGLSYASAALALVP